MALYANGDLEESEVWLKKYKKYNKNDSRVKRFLKDGNLASVVFNSRQRYEVEPVSFNSADSDFGAFKFLGNIYFASSRRDVVTGETYGWNDEPWLDLFAVQEDNPMSEPIRLKEISIPNSMKVRSLFLQIIRTTLSCILPETISMTKKKVMGHQMKSTLKYIVPNL
ncbi:hypothetical protein [Maribacter litoralis]|uniref:hypothetical protein n=1 Tax=Maribacter litoralis TaxID=2059726 RepID=UPI003F5CDC64